MQLVLLYLIQPSVTTAINRVLPHVGGILAVGSSPSALVRIIAEVPMELTIAELERRLPLGTDVYPTNRVSAALIASVVPHGRWTEHEVHILMREATAAK